MTEETKKTTTASKATTAKEKPKPKPKTEAAKVVPPLQDRWTIYLLCYFHQPTEIQPHFIGSQKILRYHFGTEAYENYDKWMRGETEGVFGIVRKLKEIDDQFKGNLKRFANVEAPAKS